MSDRESDCRGCDVEVRDVGNCGLNVRGSAKARDTRRRSGGEADRDSEGLDRSPVMAAISVGADGVGDGLSCETYRRGVVDVVCHCKCGA